MRPANLPVNLQPKVPKLFARYYDIVDAETWIKAQGWLSIEEYHSSVPAQEWNNSYGCYTAETHPIYEIAHVAYLVAKPQYQEVLAKYKYNAVELIFADGYQFIAIQLLSEIYDIGKDLCLIFSLDVAEYYHSI